jgi:hypothetical protein
MPEPALDPNEPIEVDIKLLPNRGKSNFFKNGESKIAVLVYSTETFNIDDLSSLRFGQSGRETRLDKTRIKMDIKMTWAA